MKLTPFLTRWSGTRRHPYWDEQRLLCIRWNFVSSCSLFPPPQRERMPTILLSYQVQARLNTSHNNKTLMFQYPPLCGLPILRSIIQGMVSNKAALAHTAPVKDTTTCSADLHLYPTPNVSSLSDPLNHFIQFCKTCKLKACPPPLPCFPAAGSLHMRLVLLKVFTCCSGVRWNNDVLLLSPPPESNDANAKDVPHGHTRWLYWLEDMWYARFPPFPFFNLCFYD